MENKNIFILGSRGYTKNYGGWETFVQNLINHWKNKNTHFYVYEIVHKHEEEGVFEVNEITTCIRLYVKQTGYIAMVLFDIKSMLFTPKFIKKNQIKNSMLYILGPRIGMFFLIYRPYLKKKKLIIMENPAGLEWRRGKWNKLVQQYVKISAYTMAKACDYLICDSRGIVQAYNKIIKSKRPIKKYISYGTIVPDKLDGEMPSFVRDFYIQKEIKPYEYYLILGRFVPENNYETMLKGFIHSKTKKKLIIICNVEVNKFYRALKNNTNYEEDDRIKILGAIYDKQLLNYIRQYAYGYIHGHSVGGTNPGLLEAMATTSVNILYDVPFNREVGEKIAFYFKNDSELSLRIKECENITLQERKQLNDKARLRMKNDYSWEKIIQEYENLFESV